MPLQLSLLGVNSVLAEFVLARTSQALVGIHSKIA
jgi:hypothetical protein